MSDDDSADVTVIDPSIRIVKSASPAEVRLPGGAVTWTATVTNTGDTPLFDLVVSDDTCSPMEYQSGDTGNDTISQPGEAWVYTCSGEVAQDTTNTAGVTAVDVLSGDVTDTATADVSTFDASIDLVKVPSQELVPTGTTVTYTYTATNTGTDALTNVQIDRRHLFDPIVGPAGDTGGDATMDPGEVWTYTCDHAIGVETTNQATITGTDHLGGTVDAFALATVTPFESGHPSPQGRGPDDPLRPGAGHLHLHRHQHRQCPAGECCRADHRRHLRARAVRERRQRREPAADRGRRPVRDRPAGGLDLHVHRDDLAGHDEHRDRDGHAGPPR